MKAVSITLIILNILFAQCFCRPCYGAQYQEGYLDFSKLETDDFFDYEKEKPDSQFKDIIILLMILILIYLTVFMPIFKYRKSILRALAYFFNFFYIFIWLSLLIRRKALDEMKRRK